jgi:trimeric autotransporter adhesin
MPNPHIPLAFAVVVAALAFADPPPAEAQSDILLRLRSGSPAGDRFRVDSAGGFVALGQIGIGIIPASGPGERTMWHPWKAAFRSGSAGGSGSTAWDDANIGFYSWAGGYQTRAGAYAALAFGEQTVVTGVHGVGLGAHNEVAGIAGFAAGVLNECSASYCTVTGYSSRAAGLGAVALGHRVHASADYAVALGNRAHAKLTGTFVAADASTTDSLRSSAHNQFSARYAGGYRLFTNATLTAGVTMNAGGTTWNVVSDRSRKENFAEVDGEDVLRRLRSVPVSSWNYIAEGREVRHIGPMAQDWHAAFALNDDPLTINQGDFDGINLAAVQALERRTTEQAETIAAQAERIRALEADGARRDAEVAELRRMVEALRQP